MTTQEKSPFVGPEPLRETHKRASFSSGNVPLDNYLKQKATQDSRRGVAFPYVLTDLDGNVIGYHTLTATSIEIVNLPEKFGKKLPPHGVLGATLIGRLAVDLKYARRGIGTKLLAHAVKLAFDENPAASIAVIVHALNDDAVKFYKALGFTLLPDFDRTMFLLRDSLKKYLKS
jgi:GNAT superfamily N-acetyltransferase